MTWFVILAAPVAGLLAFLAVTQARLRAFQAAQGDAPARVPTALRHALHEAIAILRVGAWHLRALGADAWRSPARATGRPVVCVHGLSQNGTNLWGIRLALEGIGRPTRAVSLGRMGRPLPGYLPGLAAALREADAPDGLDVVAHSMGGVVLRMVLATDRALAARVRTVVTLGTPHHGTAALLGLPAWFEAADLRLGSALLTSLPTLAELLPHAKIVTVAGANDAIVYPRGSCHSPGATAVDLAGVGHAGLLVAEAAVASVLHALAADVRPEDRFAAG